jgi:tetratricopeptide (TPR) repeat protein
MFRLNPKDAAATFEAWPKKKLSADALKFGEQQLRQMLSDRPAMTQYGNKANSLYQWAARKFAGEDLGNKIFWRSFDPRPIWNAGSGPLDQSIDAANLSVQSSQSRYICVRRTYKSGPHVGEDLSLEEVWGDAIFELYNNVSAKDFDRVDAEAVFGKLSRHDYAKERIEVEGIAAEKLRAFYIHVFLPLAAENHLATHPEYWYVASRSGPNDNLFLLATANEDPHWRAYEHDYDLIVTHGLLQKNDYGKALKLTTETLKEARTSEEKAAILVARGTVYATSGDFEKAMADFDEAISLTPKSAEAYGSRGWAYARYGDFDNAIDDLSTAVRFDPCNAAAYCVRGWAEENKGDSMSAITDFTEAIRLNSQYATDAYCQRGWIYSERGRLDKAIADYTEAIRLAPKCAASYVHRGSLYLRKGNVDKALADVRTAMTLDPKNEEARNLRDAIRRQTMRATSRSGAATSRPAATTSSPWNLDGPVPPPAQSDVKLALPDSDVDTPKEQQLK